MTSGVFGIARDVLAVDAPRERSGPAKLRARVGPPYVGSQP